jgi:hypothetical protein
MTPDGQRLTRIRPVLHEGQTTFVYEIMDPETFAIIESVSVDATWQRGSFAPSNSGYVIAYLSEERRVILENPMTGAELSPFNPSLYQGKVSPIKRIIFWLWGHHLAVGAVRRRRLLCDTDRDQPGVGQAQNLTAQPMQPRWLAVDGQSQQKLHGGI